MAILRIYQDSRAPGLCRSCGAVIVWAELTTRKRHPFDAPLKVIRSQASLTDGRIIEDVDTSVSSTHFATCPDGKSWSRRRQPLSGRTR